MSTQFIPFDNTSFAFYWGNTTVTGNTSTTTFDPVYDLFNDTCGYTVSIKTVTDDLPNADDPTEPGFTRTKKDVISYTVSGSGYVAENHKFWLQQIDTNTPQLCRWGQTGDDGWQRQANLLLTKYDPSFSTMKNAWKVTVEFTPLDVSEADWGNAVSNASYIQNLS